MLTYFLLALQDAENGAVNGTNGHADAVPEEAPTPKKSKSPLKMKFPSIFKKKSAPVEQAVEEAVVVEVEEVAVQESAPPAAAVAAVAE